MSVAGFQPHFNFKASDIADTTHIPNQEPNNSGDMIRLSIGFMDTSNSYTVATPAGWSQRPGVTWPQRQDDLTVYDFYKQSTGDETFPNLVVTGGTVEMSIMSAVYPDADFVSGPFGDTDLDKSSSNDPFNSITTVANYSYVDYTMFMHRRTPGWNANNTTVNMEFTGDASTGGTTNNDCFVQNAIDYAISSGMTLTPPRPSQSEDNVKMAVEIRTNGNVIPTLISDFADGSNLTGYNQGTSDNFRDALMRSGYTHLGAIVNYNFTNSDVNSGANTIDLGVDLDEGWVVQADANGGTLDSALTDGAYYWLRPTASGVYQLSECEGDIDSNSEYYNDGGSLKSAVNLNGNGSGTVRLRDCGFVFSNNGDNMGRWPAGSTSVLTDFSGDYNGNSVGSQKTRVGYSREFSTPIDLSSQVICFTHRYGSSNFDFTNRGVTLIDDNDEWYSILTYNENGKGFSNATFSHCLDVDGDYTNSEGYSESGGTFDSTQVKHICFWESGISTDRAESNNSMSDPVYFVKPYFYGGSAALPMSFKSIAEVMNEKLNSNFADSLTNRQSFFRIPFDIGATDRPVYIDENAVHVEVPIIGDGINEVQSYFRDFTITLNPQSGDTLNMESSTIADSNGFLKEVHSLPASGNFNFDSRQFVNTRVTLSANTTYTNCNFVDCLKVIDNDAQIRNSVFSISDNVGADTALIDFSSTTDIESSTFTLNSEVTTGHALAIAGAAIYSFTDLTFTGFGATGSVTAAVYNNSGGAVTINVSGGSSPTYRNGASASTTVSASVPVSVTVTTDGTTAIENARVYLRESGGGPVILNGLSNVSGIVSGSFSGSTPQAVEGWVRKSSSSPYYKTFNLGGSITSSGFSATAIMALDE